MSVSWLQIERYALGELDTGELRAVEAALAADEEARAMLGAVREDARPLPALSAPARTRSAGAAGDPAPANRARWPVAGALALAAAAALAVLVPWRIDPDGLPPAERTYKGGALAIELVRERGGVVVEAPADVAVGDRMLVRLTCPPGERAYDLVVYQDGAAWFPLPPAGPVACGNRVALPGAFAVDSAEPLTVCAVVDEVPARSELAATGPDGLGEEAVCAAVAGAP